MALDVGLYTLRINDCSLALLIVRFVLRDLYLSVLGLDLAHALREILIIL